MSFFGTQGSQGSGHCRREESEGNAETPAGNARHEVVNRKQTLEPHSDKLGKLGGSSEEVVILIFPLTDIRIP